MAPGSLRRVPRSGRTMGVLGAAVLAVMTLACLVTLPWTLGRTDASAPRRYEATNLQHALLPPSWAAHAPDEQRRREEARQQAGRPPRVWLGADRLGRDLLVRCLAGGGI
ncbi:MAG: hypothetical protein ACYSUA_06420, partial [Planctomycetota bacterium]